MADPVAPDKVVVANPEPIPVTLVPAVPMSTPATVADGILGVAGAAAPFIPNPLIAAVLILVAKYGPGVISQIDALLRNPNSTLADVQAIFSDLKPYDFFGIPDVAPLPPGTVVTTTTVTPAKPSSP